MAQVAFVAVHHGDDQLAFQLDHVVEAGIREPQSKKDILQHILDVEIGFFEEHAAVEM